MRWGTKLLALGIALAFASAPRPVSATESDSATFLGPTPIGSDPVGVAPAEGAQPYKWAILTAITVPQPLAVGVLAVPSYNPDLAYYLEGGWFRFGFGNNRSINDWSVAAGVRYRPFSHWLVTGVSFGYRRVGLNVDISGMQAEGEPIASQASLDLNALFFGLFVGGQWQLSEKVAIGFDVGMQLAVYPWGDVTIAADPSSTDNTDLSVDAEKPLRRIANLPIPQIALVRFIWYL